MSDDLFELDRTRHLTREEAAGQLRALADSLARHNSVEVERNGKRVTIAVPDEVAFKVGVEVGDGNELEVEISW